MKRKSNPVAFRRMISLVLAATICISNSAACLAEDSVDQHKDSAAEKHFAGLPVFTGDRVRMLLKSDLQLAAQPSSGFKFEFDARRPSSVDRLSGVVRQSTRQTLVLWNRDLSKEQISVPVSSIELLEVRRGHRSYVLPGVLLGIVLGAIWADSYEPPPPDGFLDFDIDLTPILYFLGPVCVGSILGAVLSGETWERSPLASPETSNSRLGKGPSLAVSLQF